MKAKMVYFIERNVLQAALCRVQTGLKHNVFKGEEQSKTTCFKYRDSDRNVLKPVCME